MAASGETPWHEAFPKPRNQNPAAVSKEELLQRLRSGEKSGKDFILVDLRKNDYEGGTIRGSLNLPAQTLYPTLPTLLELCKSSGVKQAIFYCGSSSGRGTRAAGWFDDLLSDSGTKDVESAILREGIKGWATAGEDYVDLMDGFDAKHWGQFKS